MGIGLATTSGSVACYSCTTHLSIWSNGYKSSVRPLIALPALAEQPDDADDHNRRPVWGSGTKGCSVDRVRVAPELAGGSSVIRSGTFGGDGDRHNSAVTYRSRGIPGLMATSSC